MLTPPSKLRRSAPESDAAITRRAATLRDVAARAGVSAATVSVVLNNTRSGTRVSADTRERIFQAAELLRYRPNAAARGIKRQRMDTIGVVSVIDSGELNLYFLELLNGILEGASQRGLQTTVFSVENWQNDERRLLGYCDGRVDGMVLIGPTLNAEFAGTLRESMPFVTIHGNSDLPSVWNLDVDNEAGAYEIVRHLISRGHRRIAHLTGRISRPISIQRLDGYRRALAEAGIEYDERLVIPSWYSITAGRQCTTEWLAARTDEPLPTAIFCASDAIAVGCLEALAIHGINVPDDISVAGFDDTLAAQMTTPPLTTVRQPFRSMGRNAVELLLAQIDGSATGDGIANASAMIRCFDMELIVRRSVGPPREDPKV